MNVHHIVPLPAHIRVFSICVLNFGNILVTLP